MKTLSEFLARRIIDRQDYFGANAEKEYEEMIKWYGEDITKGIEAYKKHLQNDRPKTVQWTMIEKQLISALNKMQSHNHLNDYESKKIIEHEIGCASYNEPPAGFASSVSDCDCKVEYPICPLNLYFEGDEDKIDLNKCDFENRSCSETCKKGKFKCTKCNEIFNEFIKAKGTEISYHCPNCKARKEFCKEL